MLIRITLHRPWQQFQQLWNSFYWCSLLEAFNQSTDYLTWSKDTPKVLELRICFFSGTRSRFRYTLTFFISVHQSFKASQESPYSSQMQFGFSKPNKMRRDSLEPVEKWSWLRMGAGSAINSVYNLAHQQSVDRAAVINVARSCCMFSREKLWIKFRRLNSGKKQALYR